MELICSNCNKKINPTNINVGTNLAKCEHCNSLHRASDLMNIEGIGSISNPPNGTSIQLTTGIRDNFEIHLPKRGFKISDLPMLIFTLLWIGFLSVWTLGAIQGGVFFALFSVPFWLFGITMLVGLLNSIGETQTLLLNGEYLTLIKTRPINSNTYDFKLSDIQSVKIKNLKSNPYAVFGNFNYWRFQWSYGAAEAEFPAIITGAKTEFFFEGINDAEQEWITKYVNTIIARRKKNAR